MRFKARCHLVQLYFLIACLADEEMKLDEEKIDDLTRREEYERIKAQLNAKRLEEERKIAEEKRYKLSCG